MSEEDNIFVTVIEALDPVIDVVLDVIPPPINFVVGFLWGGIRELILEILFG